MGGSDSQKGRGEAFDFSTEVIFDWEISKVRYAVGLDEVYLSPHAEEQSIKRNFDIDDCYHVITYGKAKSKDLLYNNLDRPAGINFEGNIKDGRYFLVKVGWWRGYYEIATAHEKR